MARLHRLAPGDRVLEARDLHQLLQRAAASCSRRPPLRAQRHGPRAVPAAELPSITWRRPPVRSGARRTCGRAAGAPEIAGTSPPICFTRRHRGRIVRDPRAASGLDVRLASRDVERGDVAPSLQCRAQARPAGGGSHTTQRRPRSRGFLASCVIRTAVADVTAVLWRGPASVVPPASRHGIARDSSRSSSLGFLPPLPWRSPCSHLLPARPAAGLALSCGAW